MSSAVDLPRHERERLARTATGRGRRGPSRDGGLSAEQQRRFEELVARRLAGTPLQYLEGTAQFGPIEVAVDRRALIPRPETEQLWELAIAALEDAGPGTVVVDMGTGSGVLALALKHTFPQARVYGVDVSEEAVALAGENAAGAGLEVTFLRGDLFDPLPARLKGRLDLVVSNPPYIPEDDWPELPAEVRDHEPREALVAGPRGTEVLARIADEAYWWLGVGGYVVCEIGETQGREVELLFGAYDRAIRRDLAGRDRFVVARKGAACCI